MVPGLLGPAGGPWKSEDITGWGFMATQSGSMKGTQGNGNLLAALWSARCSLVLMFPSPYVPRFMILVLMFLMFPSPYVPQKCSPVPLFPKFTLPSPCVPQYPCFPHSPVPLFPSPCAPQSICFPVPINVHQSLCSSVPMFPKLIHQSLCSPPLLHRSFHPLYSPNMFPSTYVPPPPPPPPPTTTTTTTTTEYGYKSYRLQNGGTGAVDSR